MRCQVYSQEEILNSHMEAQRKKEILPQVASLVDIARYGPQQDTKQRVCIKKKEESSGSVHGKFAIRIWLWKENRGEESEKEWLEL